MIKANLFERQSNEVKFDEAPIDCLLSHDPAKFVSHVEKLYNTVDTYLFLDNLD